MVRTGLSAFMPDCSTIAKPPCLCTRNSSADIRAMSIPSKRISPPSIRAGGFDSRVRAKPSVDLPEPDSPTSPTNSPCSRSKETFDTARTGAEPFDS
jgi:hypothetical protein